MKRAIELSRRLFSRQGVVEVAAIIEHNRRRLMVLGILLSFAIITYGAKEVFEGAAAFIGGAPMMAIQLVFTAVMGILHFAALMFFLSRPRKYQVTPDDPQIGLSFADYRGQPDLLEHAQSTVRILRGAQRFEGNGGEMPKGMLLSGPPGTGKCVVGDTLVLTNKGLMRIDDVPRYFYVAPDGAAHGVVMPTFDIATSAMQQATASHWWALGRHATRRVQLRQGLRLEGTPEHPVVVMRDGELAWHRLADLRVGDQVAVALGTQQFGNDTRLDADTAYLIGLLTGDGHLASANRVELRSADAEVHAFFDRYMHERYGCRPLATGLTHVVSSWKIKTDLIEAGVTCVLARNKRIPESVLQAPRPIVVAYLQGLFDADGSAVAGRGRLGRVEYSTASPVLADQLTAMLYNLGVAARREHRTYRGRDHWRISITGTALRQFMASVGFRLPRKQALLAAAAAAGQNTNVDLLPLGRPFLSALVSELRAAGVRGIDPHRVLKNGFISRNALQRLVETAPAAGPYTARAQRLLSAGLFFSPVVAVAEGEADVYDFTVPGPHSFVSNAFISHNTHLAGVIAAEAKVPFLYVDASSLSSMWMGVDAMIVRALFGQARRLGRKYAQPGTAGACIIFLDELDSIGQNRGGSNLGGQMQGSAGMFGMRGFALNTLLNQMDSLGAHIEDRWGHKILRWLGIERGAVPPKPVVFVIGASVTGDTPILIKDAAGEVRLKPIGDVVDAYYADGEEGVEKPAEGIMALGFASPGSRGLRFAHSKFVPVRGVYRHRVSEIYEIEYNGGVVKATGNHSVFVRTRNGRLAARMVVDLEPGDILIDLPYKLKGWQGESRAHRFGSDWHKELPVYPRNEALEAAYATALANRGLIGQAAIARLVGVSQGAISDWHNGVLPRGLSRAALKHEVPETVAVTPELCRLLGYYVAEGYARKELDFCFGTHEQELIADLKQLMQSIFGLVPDREIVRGTATNIVYSSVPVAQFMRSHGGHLAAGKHVPSWLFEAPFEMFAEFLRGYWSGDGTVDGSGRATATSVSERLILELNWLCRMHGLKTTTSSFTTHPGRRINGGRPLAAVRAYRLRLSAGDAVVLRGEQPQAKSKAHYPRIRAIRKVPFDGYVYDLCGCENEAFFGGRSPVLLHNTNRPEVLDPALTRPGRLDRKLVVYAPDGDGRRDIIEYYLSKKAHEDNMPIELMVSDSVGWTPVDIKTVLNEALIIAHDHGRDKLSYRDWLAARDMRILGIKQPIRGMSDEEKRLIAYHEAGHAVVAYYLQPHNRIQKASIIRMGSALGVVQRSSREERHTRHAREIETDIMVSLGSRAAEEDFLGTKMTGAGNDLQNASRMAIAYVGSLGMGPTLLTIGDISPGSEPVMRRANQLLEHLYGETRRLLRDKADAVHALAAALIEQGELIGPELDEIFTRAAEANPRLGREFKVKPVKFPTDKSTGTPARAKRPRAADAPVPATMRRRGADD